MGASRYNSLSMLQAYLKNKKEVEALNKIQQVKDIKAKLAKKFGSKCYLCGTERTKRGFTFHHRWYIQNDVTHSQFPKNTSGTLEYYTKLTPLIRSNPKRFRYLCNPCHQSFERIFRFGDKKLNALIKERKLTKNLREKHKYD